MNAIQTIFDYHETTKHRLERYARSLGYMDWATQPDPFRSYEGARRIVLPLASGNPTPPYHLIFEPAALPAAPLIAESLSQLMQFSLGLAAWKRFGDERWALRCNASSGNLHPTEAYLIIPPLEAVHTTSSVCHYSPKEHMLEAVAEFETSVWESLPAGSFFIALGSVLWREAWKYGERSFRYSQLDAGHAWRALEVSANALGWHCQRVQNCGADALERLIGLDQGERFIPQERESADMLLLFTPEPYKESLDLDPLLCALPEHFSGAANRLSPGHVHWEAIDRVEQATRADPSQLRDAARSAAVPREPSASAKEIILKRRSAQMMDMQRSQICKTEFMRLLASVAGPLDGKETAADLLLFVHNVQEVPPGLYLLLRNASHLARLQELTDKRFAYEEVEAGLFLLEKGDFRFKAKHISCNQDIAKDGAFTLGMLCDFSPQIERHGPQRYKELYHECGAIGQQLYLEATSLGLSATGIGCFLDDMVHELLGLKGHDFQSLYHFTVGRAIVDTRLTTEEPYTK